MFRACQLIALVLTLSGCAALQLSVIAVETLGVVSTHVVTAPGVLCTSEAMQLIRQHCIGGYIETKRVDYPGSRAVYATCLQADGSPAVSEPCEYDADEHVGFGQMDVTIPDGYP